MIAAVYESIDHPNRLNTRGIWCESHSRDLNIRLFELSYTEASDSVSLSKCIRNPAYIHLGPRREERQAAAETRGIISTRDIANYDHKFMLSFFNI